MSRILIAEDEDRISSFVEKGLRAAGFSTTVAATGEHALGFALSNDYDLVLLDVGLPGIDGFEVLRQLRLTDTGLPVIMLTARSSLSDTVAGLDGGANDYLPKPFKFDELLARVRVAMRDVGQAVSSIIEHDGLVLDLLTRRVRAGDRSVDLSAREFALAEEFLRHPDQVLSREQLLSRVWGVDFDPGSNVVDVYVRYLRAKLGAGRIETVRGAGYRLT
jgi:two-component system copper resistance phosphate regulon response regulator CusR